MQESANLFLRFGCSKFWGALTTSSAWQDSDLPRNRHHFGGVLSQKVCPCLHEGATFLDKI